MLLLWRARHAAFQHIFSALHAAAAALLMPCRCHATLRDIISPRHITMRRRALHRHTERYAAFDYAEALPL